MIHFTLNTGHAVEQPNEGPFGIPQIMAPILRGGNLGTIAPSLAAFRVEVSRSSGAAIFTVWRGRDPLVACGLALTAKNSELVWTEVERLYLMASDTDPLAISATHAPTQPELTPWLGVVLLPALNFQTLKDVRWLGDFERCMAWAIMSDESLGQTR